MLPTMLLLASVFLVLVLVFFMLEKILRSRKNKFNDEANCPICGAMYDTYSHRKVVYHIFYHPAKWIYACNTCNSIEYLHRTGNLQKILENIENLKK
jgi:C4-type Zn-finger protein